MDDHRRKWDRSEFEKLARERLAAEEQEVKSSSSRDIGRHEPPIKRDLLKPREYKVTMFLMLLYEIAAADLGFGEGAQGDGSSPPGFR